MLPRSKRLNLKKDFKWVSSGKRIETENLKLFINSGSSETCLVGISLSKKNFGKATDRNRAKRLASAAIEQLYSTLPKKLNLIIMPKTKILEISKEVLIKELQDALSVN